MFHVLEWFLFGMFVWCCVLCMSAISRRLSPEMGPPHGERHRSHRPSGRNRSANAAAEARDDPRDLEIRDLRKRIETLEAIITDRRYQWDDEFSRK